MRKLLESSRDYPFSFYFLGAKHEIVEQMGVGGSFDVFAELRRETPRYLRSGFEWVYRIAQDPLNRGYWKRYLVTIPWFVYRIYKEKLGGKF